MRATIDSIAAGLEAEPPRALILMSDDGAELDAGTGITMIFHELEDALRDAAPAVTFVRPLSTCTTGDDSSASRSRPVSCRACTSR